MGIAVHICVQFLWWKVCLSMMSTQDQDTNVWQILKHINDLKLQIKYHGLNYSLMHTSNSTKYKQWSSKHGNKQ